MIQHTPVHHMAMGGTLDSEWDASKDTAVPRRETIVPAYLRDTVRLTDITSETLFLKDSRDITIPNQDTIADRIAETGHNRIIGTVGTFLCPDVMRNVENHPMQKNFETLDRRLVLAASGKPMFEFLKSDGGFNLGMAYAALQIDDVKRLSIAMNHTLLEGKNVRKDLSSATFVGHEGADQIPYESCDLITAGGSIDYGLDGLDGLVPGKESCVPDYLRRIVKTRKKIFAANPFIKSSLELKDQDLAKILKLIENTRTEHVVVTLGLYRVREVQKYIKESIPDACKNKIIVLTGSRLPLGLNDMTDAPFQLGYAFGMVGFQEPGVHIAINGHMFEDEEDVISGIFKPEEVDTLHKQGIV